MPSVVRQAAAIPIMGGMVCMVTSSSGRRWVLPKGRIEAKQTAPQAALAEAWEEAGLVGQLAAQEPVGTYGYEKYGQAYTVQVFVLRVETARQNWPERHQRTREWITPDEAISRIEEPELRAMVASVCGIITADV